MQGQGQGMQGQGIIPLGFPAPRCPAGVSNQRLRDKAKDTNTLANGRARARVKRGDETRLAEGQAAAMCRCHRLIDGPEKLYKGCT